MPPCRHAAGRLRRVLDAVTAGPHPTGDVDPTPGASERGEPAGGAPRALSPEQIRQFIATGYLVFPVDGLPADFHQRFYERACTLKRAGQPIGGAELEAESDAVISSAATRGALSSLLGSDYAGAAWSGGVLEASSDRDQSFHKDNTHHATRSHAPRHLSLFYYPGPVSLAEGPTAFVPGSAYWAVDREGLGMGEERLIPPMMPPAEGWDNEQWQAAVAHHEDGPHHMPLNGQGMPGQIPGPPPIPYSEHDDWLGSADRLLDVPGLQGHSVTHPGGVCVLWHDDIMHRKSRQRPGGKDLGPEPTGQDHFMNGSGSDYRPILRFGFHRCTEPDAAPTSPSSFPADAAVEAWVEATAEHGPRLSGDLLEDTAEHVWGPHLRWLSGAPAGDCAASGERLAEVFLSEASGEAARVAAAYGLGRSGQLEPLVAELDCAGQERRFRAACHGLGAAGDAALPALVAALEAPSPKSDRPLFRKEKICHAIGNAAGPATLVEAMGALSHAAEAAWEEIALVVSEVPDDERPELIAAATRGLRGYEGKVFHNLVPAHPRCNDARGLLADAAQASGLLGSRAMAAEGRGELGAGDAAEVCRGAVRLLRRLIVEPDEGSMLPSRFPLNMLENNAVEGLMQLCSSPACPPAILPPGRPADLPQFATIKELPTVPLRVAYPGDLPRPAAKGAPVEVGPQVAVPSGKEHNPRLRLALARLGWLTATNQLRGPAQKTVLEECRVEEAWRPLLAEDALVLPTA